ncbi:MAG TPA: LuxR C-terminal-related transcriptional regulator [Pseudonocardiaceae bacterium]|jgi:predicted ATPase/DNA-binding CsgD family transcriptional regulator|nr:LuxR C-terminal-related transcriptional regulator [Pseudonocardiaceae bacterium]
MPADGPHTEATNRVATNVAVGNSATPTAPKPAVSCESCGSPLPGGADPLRKSAGGRPARYCSNACRQRAFRRRAAEKEQDTLASAQPLLAPPAGVTLVAALDSFVGRKQELSQLRVVSRSARLLTLIGPAGVGKTRLARELLATARSADVRFVSLADAEDAQALQARIGAATGLRGRPSAAELARTIGVSQLVLVLDSCERVAQECAELVAMLLGRCRGLRVVATAREELRVSGEVLFRVPALPHVETNTRGDRGAPVYSDAVRLFVERARDSDPAFELTMANAGLVNDICHRLDGLPLAIELAARRVRTLPLTSIMAGLDDPLALLTDGSRTGPARHRDLRAALDWSYRCLEPEEQVVFRRISVLAADFSVPLVLAVCGEGLAGAGEMLRLLCSLADKSMLAHAKPGEHGEARFHQLSLVRAYGVDRLAVTDELDRTRQRLTDWLAGLAEPITTSLFYQGADFGQLHHQREDLIDAVERTEEEADHRYVNLVIALATVWRHQDRIPEGRTVLAKALDRVHDPADRAELLISSGWLAALQTDGDEALWFTEEAVRVERGESDPFRLAKALGAVATVRMLRHEVAEAITAYRECLTYADPLGQPLDLALCRRNLAWALFQLGETEEATALVADALPIYRRSAPKPMRGAVLHTAGMLRLVEGDVAAAEAAFEEALRGVPDNGYQVPNLVEAIGLVALQRNDFHRARCLFSGAAQLRRRLGLGPEPAWQHRIDDAIETTERTLGRAAATEAVTLGRRMTVDNLLAYTLRDNKDRGTENSSTEPKAGEPGTRRSSGLPDYPLTAREAQVVGLLASGLTNQQIATRLQVSVSTVKTHLLSIRNKLGLRYRTQIAVWATSAAPDSTTDPRTGRHVS